MMSTTATLETVKLILPANVVPIFREEAMRRGIDADAVITEALMEWAAQIEDKPYHVGNRQ